VALIFRGSASRHGISHDRATFVIRDCRCPLIAPDPDREEADVLVFLGPDANGVLLEVVGIEVARGDLVVIHAMRMRRKYADAYAEVMACR